MSKNTITKELYPSELVRLSCASTTLGLAIFLLLTTTREDAIEDLQEHIKDGKAFASDISIGSDIFYYRKYEYFFMGISDANFDGIKGYFSVRYSKYLLQATDTVDVYEEIHKFAALVWTQYKKDGVLQ